MTEPPKSEISKWRSYAQTLGFAKTEHAEKDYLQELLLSELYSGKIGKVLIFRGGTAISKVYGSGRFSEDLDFIISKDAIADELNREVEAAINRLNFYYATKFEAKHFRNMFKYGIKIDGPVYAITRNVQARESVEVDVNTYESPLYEANEVYRVPIYSDIRPYMLKVASIKELLADKVKAMLERTKPVARDLYDAWILIKKYRIKLDITAVDKKMKMFGKHPGEEFSTELLLERVKAIERQWNTELSRLMVAVPKYKDVASSFKAAIGQSPKH